jgi:uncharacterized membrane protein
MITFYSDLKDPRIIFFCPFALISVYFNKHNTAMKNIQQGTIKIVMHLILLVALS